MKARKRFLLLFVAFLAFIHFGLNRLRNKSKNIQKNILINESIIDRKISQNYYKFEFNLKNEKIINQKISLTESRFCRMSSCFDFKKCFLNNENKLKIHLYPLMGANEPQMSGSFSKIVSFIRNSDYYESDPQKACLFLPLVDTLDRDPLSQDYQKHFSQSLSMMSPLFEGKNHLIFNLYSGSWPQYHELDFGFNAINQQLFKFAILIKASQSYHNYRPDFDVSFPLFGRNHPQNGPQFLSHENNHVQSINGMQTESDFILNAKKEKKRKSLLVFKGKRYLYGIGSETRNSLYHLNNGEDILIVTTCKHGKKWREIKDSNCEKDNNEYEKYDYWQLMENSTFCLIPRGRRLASFRFLEALSVGCIPVVLSNDWVLPFNEVIDWSRAIVRADERLLLQIPEQLRQISQQRLNRMRSQCIALYNNYFSSVERIVSTALTIIEERILLYNSRSIFLWNLVNPGISSLTGANWFQSNYSDQLQDFPGFRSVNMTGFTAIVTVNKPINQQLLIKLLTKTLPSCSHLSTIIVNWCLPSISIPQTLFQLPFVHIYESNDSYSKLRLFDTKLIKSDAIFQLDAETSLSSEEMDFGFIVWRAFSSRIVGFSARDHNYDNELKSYTYSSKWTNQYSVILLDAAFYHRYYNFLFNSFFVKQLYSLEDNECVDLSLAFLVSHITREGPIKISQRKKTINSSISSSFLEWNQRRNCFQTLLTFYKYLPLIRSQLRFDPLLFKDNVSIWRKKYKKFEQ